MIHLGDCIDVMAGLPGGSVDMVLSDVPYGQTQNAWDVPIPFAPMWEQLRRVAKPSAAIVLMAIEPFASRLICSNLSDFKYDLIWSKNKPSGHLNAKRRPLRSHEQILVFYKTPPVFNPQKTTGHPTRAGVFGRNPSSNYGKQRSTDYEYTEERYPTSVLAIPAIANNDPDKHHPTQKPVDLMAWLIRSYTAPGDTILDFAAGSGTTAVAALREGRRYICIEQQPNYFEIAERRVALERGAGTLLENVQ